MVADFSLNEYSANFHDKLVISCPNSLSFATFTKGIINSPHIMILCYRDMNMWLVSTECILRTERVRRCGEYSAVVFHGLNSSRSADHRVGPLWGVRGEASSFK
jgi:hypothetical protein